MWFSCAVTEASATRRVAPSFPVCHEPCNILASSRGLAYRACRNNRPIMILKLIALISAAIPIYLFLRAMFGSRPSKLSAAWREAKKQIDLAIYIFLGIIGCIVAFALGKLVWAWWMSV
jgi:hypothetical protein